MSFCPSFVVIIFIIQVVTQFLYAIISAFHTSFLCNNK